MGRMDSVRQLVRLALFALVLVGISAFLAQLPTTAHAAGGHVSNCPNT
jgi:hypothetical protein